MIKNSVVDKLIGRTADNVIWLIQGQDFYLMGRDSDIPRRILIMLWDSMKVWDNERYVMRMNSIMGSGD